jgi:hypothetical protein
MRARDATTGASPARPRAAAATAQPLLAPAGLRVPDVLTLQHGAGNRAVLARLKINTGLRRHDRAAPFAKDARDWWADPANKAKTLKDYPDFLIGKANALLKTMGSYEVAPTYTTTGSASGVFSRVTWTMEINTTKFSDRPHVTKTSDLTLDEAAEIADTVYHEIRHSEQYFRIARIRAARSKKTGAAIAKEIETDMSIPPKVAQAAAAAPMKAAKDNRYLIAEAKDWESITIGRHAEYKGIVNTWMDEADEARTAVNGVDATNLTATRDAIKKHVDDWATSDSRNKFVGVHLKETDAIASKSRMDVLVVKNLTAIKATIGSVRRRWKAVTDTWAGDSAARRLRHLTAMQGPLRTLANQLYAAYRDHLHEKDAWETGAVVGGEFRRLGPPPPPPPPPPPAHGP